MARSALADLRHLEELPEARAWRSASTGRPRRRRARWRCSTAGDRLALSDVLPLFENMGVQAADERPYPIKPRDRESAWIYDFGLVRRGETDPDAGEVREAFQDAFVRAWRRDVENDGRTGRARRRSEPAT